MPDVSRLVKKPDDNTKTAELNAKVPSLDGKIDENKSIGNELIEPIKDILSLWMGSIAFNGGDGFQAYLIIKSVHRYVKIIANALLNTLLNGNLKDYLMKVLKLFLHLITVLHH